MFLGFQLLTLFMLIQQAQAENLSQGAWCVADIVSQKPVYDFETDASLQKYVSPTSSLQNEQYVPWDLQDIEKISSYIEARGNVWQLRSEAASALADLAAAFHQAFDKSLVVVSSFRWYAYQQKLLSSYKEKYGDARAQWFSAKPGHSEHQLGLAVDIFNASTDNADGYKNYFAWMREHAHEYGWTQSYQKWAAIDGYVVEPWHWRYVGIELATYLWENKMTLSEYVRFWRVRK